MYTESEIDEAVARSLERTTRQPMSAAEYDRAYPAVGARFKGIETMLSDLAQKSAGRGFSLNSGSVMGSGHRLLGAIPDSERKLVELAEVACTKHARGEVSTIEDRGGERHRVRHDFYGSDPVLKAAGALWFKWQFLKKSKPGDYFQFVEQHAKLSEALGVQKVALQEDTTNEGAEFVPTIVQSEILRIRQDASVVLRAGARRVPMTTKTHSYPAENAFWTVGIFAEEASITDSVPATPITNRSLTAKKFAGFGTLSNELIQDNVVLVFDWVAQNCGEKIARKEDTEALEGDGTNFTGLVGAAGVNAKSSGANGDRVYYSLLIDSAYAASEESSRESGAFFMHPTVWGSILKTRVDAVSAADGAGVSFVQPSAGPLGDIPRSLMGFPVYLSSGILTNRAVGTGTNRTNVYFGPPRDIIFGDLLGLTIDLNPYSKFQTFQTDFRVMKRTAILVGLPANFTKYTAIDGTLSMGK